MRKITKESVAAFLEGKTLNKKNMRVEHRIGTSSGKIEAFMYLHGNMIANKGEGFLYISHCGWQSNTTKERLNGVLGALKLNGIHQSNWTWYLGGEVFQGNKTFKI